MKDLKRRTFRGIVWTYASQIVSFVGHLATFAVLGRYLSPREMGLVSIAMTVVVFANVFGGLGLGRALIQRREVSEQEYSTVFWASIGFGVLGWALVALVAWPAALFFGEAELTSLIAITGLTVLLRSLPQVHLAKLERELHFRGVSVAQVLGMTVPYTVVTILTAIAGAGAWSPVIGTLVGVAAQAVILVFLVRWRPAWQLSLVVLKQMLGFGASFTGASGVAFAIDSLDYYAIGRILGSRPLGFYGMAFRVALLPVRMISGAVSRVVYAAFCEVQTDHERLNRAYTQMNRYVAFVTFPMMGGLMVVAEPTIALLLGAKWLPAVPTLRILCVVGALSAVRATVGTALNAVGRAEIGFYANLAVLAVFVPALIILTPHGIEATAIAVAIATVVNFLPLQLVLTRLTGLSVLMFLRALLAPLGLTAAMAAVVWLVTLPIDGYPARLSLGVLVGVISYSAMVFAVAPNVVREILALVRARRPSPEAVDEVP